MSRNLYYLVYRGKVKVPKLALRVLDVSFLDFIRVRGEKPIKCLL